MKSKENDVHLALSRAMRTGAQRAIQELSTNDQIGFVPAKVWARRQRVQSAINMLTLELDAWEKQLIAESYE